MWASHFTSHPSIFCSVRRVAHDPHHRRYVHWHDVRADDRRARRDRYIFHFLFPVFRVRDIFSGTLVFFRFFLGFGIGGDYPLSSVIMSECALLRANDAQETH